MRLSKTIIPKQHKVDLLKIWSGKCLLFDSGRPLKLTQDKFGGNAIHNLPLFYDNRLDNTLQFYIIYRPVADYYGMTDEYAVYTEELIGQEQQIRRLICEMMANRIRKSLKSETLYGIPNGRLSDTLLIKQGIPLLGKNPYKN